MPDFRSAMRLRLLEDGGKPAVLGDRIDFVRAAEADSQAANLPRLVLQVMADPRPDHFQGKQELRSSRVQLTAWSSLDLVEALEIAEWAIAVLESPATVAGVRFERPSINGPEDGGEQLDGLYVFRARLDVLVWHALV